MHTSRGRERGVTDCFFHVQKNYFLRDTIVRITLGLVGAGMLFHKLYFVVLALARGVQLQWLALFQLEGGVLALGVAIPFLPTQALRCTCAGDQPPRAPAIGAQILRCQ